MLRILSLLCFSVVFFACSDDSSPNATPGNSETDPSSNSGDPSSPGSNLALPSNANKSAITAKYEEWMNAYYATYDDDVADGTLVPGLAKDGTQDAARIKWVPTPNRTVSEGIGYGMLLAALNGDFTRFDKLWKYHKAYRMAGTDLMIWRVTSFRLPTDSGIATDADIDVCAALFIAYKKTGNQDYLNDAIAIGRSMHDVALDDNKLLLPAEKTNYLITKPQISNGLINISYISLAAIKLLAIHDTERDWNAVLDANIGYMQMVQNAGNGLWPDWSDNAGTPIDPGNNSCDNLRPLGGGENVSSCLVYHKEGVRTPWRIAWYYHWFGDPRAKEMLGKAFTFVSGRADSDPSKIKSWYDYNGDREPLYGSTQDARMWGSICATGLGSESNSAWNAACNERLLANNLLTTGYYEDSLFLLYLMLFNGNFEL